MMGFVSLNKSALERAGPNKDMILWVEEEMLIICGYPISDLVLMFCPPPPPCTAEEIAVEELWKVRHT
eukprot:10174554-Ditylum_brightwellii.AAC.2